MGQNCTGTKKIFDAASRTVNRMKIGIRPHAELQKRVTAGIKKVRRIPGIAPLGVGQRQVENRFLHAIEPAAHAAAEKTARGQHEMTRPQLDITVILGMDVPDPAVLDLAADHAVAGNENTAQGRKAGL